MTGCLSQKGGTWPHLLPLPTHSLIPLFGSSIIKDDAMMILIMCRGFYNKYSMLTMPLTLLHAHLLTWASLTAHMDARYRWVSANRHATAYLLVTSCVSRCGRAHSSP